MNFATIVDYILIMIIDMTMSSSSIFHVLISLLFFVLMHEPTHAIKQSYIVYLGSHSFGPNPSLLELESATNSHYDLLGSYLGSAEKAKESIIYSYNRNINGFAAILDEDEAAEIAKNPGVISIFLNKRYELHTTRSWDFLGLERGGEFPKTSLWKKTLGKDIIIGNLDSGVWPESKSFSDEGYGPIPKKWRGICQVTEGNKDNFHCNRKLIGARYFYKGYQSSPIREPNDTFTFDSARDTAGHGTHTLSTAGGNFVAGTSVFGYGNGTASGGSPKARVAAYKVCYGSCYEADILAGFEHAISDGVDVISVSLGGAPQEYSKNSLSIGSFHAVANNIVVVASGGNSGPIASSVSNLEPWVFTVGASTIDRSFTSNVILGNKQVLKGESLSELHLPAKKSYPLISGADAKADNVSAVDAVLCKEGTLDPHKVKGKIVVCLRGESSRVEKGMQASKAGAIGMVLVNDAASGGEVIADPHVLPATHINFTEGVNIFSYINSTKSPVAYITNVKTQLGVRAPSMAAFSSRGPNTIEPTILKPDITAPGVNVIAAYSLAASPSENESDKRRVPYLTMSGTSMSCPHVAGLVGLVKSAHPNWSPAAIKSAIMTTATTTDNNGGHLRDSLKQATPFAYGAGHVRPNHATNPGLVYDLNITDHLNFLCGHGYNSAQLKPFYGKPYTCPKSFNLLDFNYPTITIPDIKIGQSLTATRTVTNVGLPSEYRVLIEAPSELLVSVEPKRLIFKEKGEKREFKVTLTLKQQSKHKTEYVFGKLTWTNGRHRVGSPIVVKYPQ
ncbi:subtilisin-like protease SBT5.3 [Trifolium pratense]|uniref:subtilisin-like protease SBT5.3 n=1 Tax=Trifolium pratense TaxID=57577 RepID=UPI001E695CA6|nr:subtilisin-like protease SBT5.3 [Trifolium pratense]